MTPTSPEQRTEVDQRVLGRKADIVFPSAEGGVSPTPRKAEIPHRLARCGLGMRGIVLSYGYVTYPDGTSALAYRGRRFPKVWRRWSSRDPKWGWF